jgi:hypothetical protein
MLDLGWLIPFLLTHSRKFEKKYISYTLMLRNLSLQCKGNTTKRVTIEHMVLLRPPNIYH